MKIAVEQEKPVSNAPHNMSTKTTFDDQLVIVAILVKLYVPYATMPNIIPVQNALKEEFKLIAGCKIMTARPKMYKI